MAVATVKPSSSSNDKKEGVKIPFKKCWVVVLKQLSEDIGEDLDMDVFDTKARTDLSVTCANEVDCADEVNTLQLYLANRFETIQRNAKSKAITKCKKLTKTGKIRVTVDSHVSTYGGSTWTREFKTQEEADLIINFFKLINAGTPIEDKHYVYKVLKIYGNNGKDLVSVREMRFRG